MGEHTHNDKHEQRLIEIGKALSSETDTNALLEMILQDAKSITNADGGTLYRICGDAIKMELVHSDSLNLKLGGNSGAPVSLPTIPLYLEDGSKNLKNVVSCCYHSSKTINIADAYDNKDFDFSGTKRFDEQNNYRSKSFLAVPMMNHEGDMIGILQLINALELGTGKVVSFTDFDQQIAEALASQAAMVLTKQGLVVELEGMFESLVELVGTAIDIKSPYNGKHCHRIPDLTMMVAEAAHQTDHGYLADFKMTDADRYELKIAGWLHDCGKITTPEYVIDKSTKLETIFDRIHLVETRFEVLKRDKEIALLKQQIAALQAGDSLDSAWEAAYHAEVAAIDADLAFIQKANKGGEFMSESDQARISAFEHATWQFQGESQAVLSKEEIYNLNISRGTINHEERKIINQHIEATIDMLGKIAFPKHLRHVPEYAGGHHEKMDGTGYPKGLKREEMSIQARAMAIADIFEALTSSDRPYKSPKKLSEALGIMNRMRDNNHIDPDIYDAFIEHKVYLQYAEQFLDPSQVDVE
jgi:HD-GYP domain-containing protein (c-di-GMP phosphodiesterase class II)